MRFALLTLLALLFTAAAEAAVVNPAPDFSIIAAGEKSRSLRSFRGQSVILVIADRPKNGALKKQLKLLEEIYQQLASKGVIIVAALASEEGRIPSNVPVAIARDGAGVAAAYGVQKGFQLVVIGRDGNLDYQTVKVQAAERIRDVIQNSFEIQTSARKGN